jgi:hypothetical protein
LTRFRVIDYGRLRAYGAFVARGRGFSGSAMFLPFLNVEIT